MDIYLKLDNKTIYNFNINKEKGSNFNELLKAFITKDKITINLTKEKENFSKARLCLILTYKNDERLKINVDLNLKRTLQK